MKIGLYFGSFNPIHTGHLIIAGYVLDNTPLDKIWFVISPQNPFKKSSTLLNEYDRLHLVKLAIGDNYRFKASDIEFHLPRPSYTVNTLAYLQEKYPDEQFSIIMGSDSYQNLSRWKNAERIIADYNIFVYLRPGFPVDNENLLGHTTVLKAPLLDISSSYVRKVIREGGSPRYLLPDAVADYIEGSNYYKK